MTTTTAGTARRKSVLLTAAITAVLLSLGNIAFAAGSLSHTYGSCAFDTYNGISSGNASANTRTTDYDCASVSVRLRYKRGGTWYQTSWVTDNFSSGENGAFAGVERNYGDITACESDHAVVRRSDGYSYQFARTC